MNKHALFALLALSALPVIGCESPEDDCPNGSASEYPQYGGIYELQDYDYNPASCTLLADDEAAYAQCKTEHNLIKQAPPRQIRVTHRMEWDNNLWRHRLRFDAVTSAVDPLAARGSFVIDLADLSGGGGAFKPAKIPSGGYDQNGVFCTFYGYFYNVSANGNAMIPAPSLLKDIYWANDPLPLNPDGTPVDLPVQGADPSKSPLALTDPDHACVEPAGVDEWKRQALGDGGAMIHLTLSKYAKTDYSGCYQFGDGIIPLGDRDQDKGDITLVYRRIEKTAEYDIDLRSQGFDGIPEYVEHPNLFENISAYQ